MAVALGDDFTVAVGESGKLFVFGNNIEELTREIEKLAARAAGREPGESTLAS